MEEPPTYNTTCYECPVCGETIAAGYTHECSEQQPSTTPAAKAVMRVVGELRDLGEQQPSTTPTLTAEHLEALRLAAAHYGFWHGKDWPADRIQRLLTEVMEALQ